MKAGDMLGPYEIREPIGAGGMGEVWLAVDTRLGRRVAVKVLPESMANDRQALQRFEHEARAVAAISHPGILAIHDVGDAGGRAYVVTELLEGASLDRLLAEGKLPVRRAVEIARQVAEGLAAAHERGIIHRDVKPSNVFITEDGRAKLLDFGLAKASLPLQGAATDVATVAGTQPGVVMGTVGYMSPEQVRGEAADARSDIFALGATLYEMLTGEQPFRRATAAETMTAILREDPLEPSAGEALPAHLGRIVQRCLEKLPLERFQSARDLAFALESAAPPSGEAQAPAATSTASVRRLPAVGLALLLLALGAIVGHAVARWSAPTWSSPPRVRQLTFTGSDSAPTVSPDGRLVAYVSARDGKSRVWLRQMAGGGEQPITDGSDSNPRIAPDGNSVLFTRTEAGRQAVYRSGLVGGQARLVVDDARDADWAPAGDSIAFLRAGAGGTQLRVLHIESGQQRLLLAIANQDVSAPRFSPDGTTIALVVSPLIFGATGAYMLLVDVADGTSRQLPRQAGDQGVTGAAWTPDGRALVYGVSTSSTGDRNGMPSRIVRQPADGGERRDLIWVAGLFPPRGTYSQIGRLELLGDEALVFNVGSLTQALHEVAVADGVGSTGRRLTTGDAQDRQPVYSPDGRYVMFSSNRSGNLDLWRLEVATGELRQLTDDPAQDWDPAFLPGGEDIVWSSDRSGNLEIWTATSLGEGARQLSHNGADAQNPTATSAGGWITYTSGHPSAPGVYRMRLDGSEESLLFPVTDGTLALPELSPDGARMAVSTTVAGTGMRRLQVYPTSDPLGEPALIAEFGVAEFAPTIIFGRSRWLSPRRIAYVDRDDSANIGVWVQDFEPGIATEASRRMLAGFVRGEIVESFGIAPDGQRLVLAIEHSSRALMVAEGLDLR